MSAFSVSTEIRMHCFVDHFWYLFLSFAAFYQICGEFIKGGLRDLVHKLL